MIVLMTYGTKLLVFVKRTLVHTLTKLGSLVLPQSVYKSGVNLGLEYQRPRLLDIQETSLVLAPHPDDEVIGAGAHLLSSNKPRVAIVCPPCEKGEFDLRISESQDAACAGEYKLVHVNTMMNDGDGITGSLDQKLKKLIRETNVLFLPSPWEQHPDHVAVCALVINFLAAEKITGKRILLYEVWGSLPIFTHFNRVTSAKTALLGSFASQLANFPYAEMVEARSVYRGIFTEAGASEAYLEVDANHQKELERLFAVTK